jgi:hypothetical protein
VDNIYFDCQKLQLLLHCLLLQLTFKLPTTANNFQQQCQPQPQQQLQQQQQQQKQQVTMVAQIHTACDNLFDTYQVRKQQQKKRIANASTNILKLA